MPGNWIEGRGTSHRRGMVLLVLSAVFWSFGGILIKWVPWHPLAISGIRSAVGALVILAVFGKPRVTWSLPEIGGAIAYAGTVTLFVVANKMTTAANAILLQYTAPVYVAMCAPWYLRERTRPGDCLTIVLALMGMSLFFLDHLSGTGLPGNLVALASGACFGWFTLFLRKQKGGSPVATVFLGNLLAVFAGLPFLLSPGPAPGASGWAAIAILGTVQFALPYVLYSFALRHVTAVKATLVAMIEPILNPLWVLLLAGEMPSTLSLAGGAILLGSLALRGLSDFRRRNEGRRRRNPTE